MTSINKTICDRALNYFINLRTPTNLPSGIKIMNPYLNNETKNVTKKFFVKYFNDDKKRILAFGINPGRFGG